MFGIQMSIYNQKKIITDGYIRASLIGSINQDTHSTERIHPLGPTRTSFMAFFSSTQLSQINSKHTSLNQDRSIGIKASNMVFYTYSKTGPLYFEGATTRPRASASALGLIEME